MLAKNREKRVEYMGYFTEYDMYLFGQGTHYDIQNRLGAHPKTVDGVDGVLFDVWAPHAKNVWVTGSFNGWEQQEEYKMERLEPLGVYELFAPDMQSGEYYKYLIETNDGRLLYKADPE